MRASLSGLTIRGRCFIAAGLASIACALALGEADLLRIGIFLFALPLAAVVVVARTTYRLSCTRRLEPTRTTAGREARIQLRVDNVSRIPTGLLLVEDSLPYTLGRRPRFVLDRMEPRGVRDLDYRVRSDVRGRFRVGPLTVRLADPFGLVELVRSFSTTDTLVVTPAVSALTSVRLGGGSSGHGDAHARIVAAAGEDDVATREYRHGDDLRRVHWRSTAHYGELMVRREEQFWQSRGTLLLDTRGIAHHGTGPGSSFEWCVSAAASIGVHLARRDVELRLMTDVGQAITGLGGRDVAGGGSAFESALLDTLAVATTSRNRSLREAASSLRQTRDEDMLVAVLGATDSAEIDHLSRVGSRDAVRIALLVNTPSWTTLSPPVRERVTAAHEEADRLLRTTGWRVLSVQAGERIEAVWSRLDDGALATLAGARTPGRESA